MKPNFLQSAAWAKMNELIGYKVVTVNLQAKTPTYMIIKTAKRGRYLEIPGGPVVDWQDKEQVMQAFAKIRELAIKEKCVFIRFRPQLLKTDAHLQLMQSLGAKKAPMHLHAEHTVVIDLTKSEEELLKSMRRQTRYEVRRADKLDIKVKSGNSKELFEEFYQVQQETAKRQHFIPPSLKTLLAEREAFKDNAVIYKAYFDFSGDNIPEAFQKVNMSDSEFYFLKNEGRRQKVQNMPIAYGLILKDDDNAAYFEAASTSLNRKLPGAYALQWQVMRDLKKQGIKHYNLWGIAPPGQTHHRYSGVTTFKTGFGGEVVEFVPAQDIIINPVKYALDYAVETIRKKRRHL